MNFIRNLPIKEFTLNAVTFAAVSQASSALAGDLSPKRALTVAVSLFALSFFGNFAFMTAPIASWTGVALNLNRACALGGVAAMLKVAKFYIAKQGEALYKTIDDSTSFSPPELQCLKAYFNYKPDAFTSLSIHLQTKLNLHFLSSGIPPILMEFDKPLGQGWTRDELLLLGQNLPEKGLSDDLLGQLLPLFFEHSVIPKLKSENNEELPIWKQIILLLKHIPIERLTIDQIKKLTDEQFFWFYYASGAYNNFTIEETQARIQVCWLHDHYSKHDGELKWDDLPFEKQFKLHQSFVSLGLSPLYISPSEDIKEKEHLEAFRNQFERQFTFFWELLSTEEQKKWNDKFVKASIKPLPLTDPTERAKDIWQNPFSYLPKWNKKKT